MTGYTVSGRYLADTGNEQQWHGCSQLAHIRLRQRVNPILIALIHVGIAEGG